jgi:Pentapeptide repeats (8 copies)
MSQQRPNARRTSKRPTVARGEQKQVSEQSEQSSLQSIRPPRDDRAAWLVYWQERNQPWRTEPEINLERRVELEERRVLVPDVEKGIYPFKRMKLDRADVEWLLATHAGGPGKWSDEKEREREGLDMRGADLQHADLHQLPLTRLRGGLTFDEWRKATEEQRSSAVVLMRGARLREAQLKGADLSEAQLEGADLRNVILGDKQRIGPRLADLQWGDTNLAVVDWSQVAVLGDEHKARQKQTPDGKKKEQAERLSEYQAAVRANRQLAVALQAQGLSEEAARFAYRAQRLQRIVLRRQRKVGSYLFSRFLDLIAGYGYRPGRTVLWYLFVIVGFAVAYFALGHLPPFPDAFVFSLMSFHGRGFFPSLSSETSLHNQVVEIAAIEAVVGLLIEISFIATFTQRYFGK